MMKSKRRAIDTLAPHKSKYTDYDTVLTGFGVAV